MLIEIKELKKIYNQKTVVNIAQSSIANGETIGLVGNNGAGKTTLFRLILDLIRADHGAVFSKGMNVAEHDQWKSYTGSYLDEGFLIEYLTPEEYFELIGSLNHLSRQTIRERLQPFEEIFNGEILNKGKYLRDLSKGNKNKVGIAGAMLINPELLILDEPFANLDPTTQIRLKNLVKNFKGRETTTLISSHDLNHVTEVCDRIILLEKGEIIKDFKTNADTLKELEFYFSA